MKKNLARPPAGSKLQKKVKREISFMEKISRPPYAYLIIAGLILIIYWPVLSFYPGKFDEDLIITGNLNFLTNFVNLKEALLRDAFFSDKGVNFYRPLQNLSFMIDAHLSGPNGWGYYLMNMIIHVITCSLLYHLLRLFTDRPKNALLLTLVFAVNPLFVQAIAWAPSRGDLLIGMFGLMALVSFIRYVRSGDIKFLAVHVISFALAMFSKETAILLPIAFLFFYFFLERDRRIRIPGLIIPVLSYITVILFYFYLRSLVVKIGATHQEFGILPLLHNLRTIFEFPGKFFFPVALAPMPGYTLLNTLAGLILLLILAVLLYRFRAGNTMLFLSGLGWYFMFILPGMLYSHEFGSAAYDYLEHRAYLPLIGIVFVLYILINTFDGNRQFRNLPFFLLALIFIYGIETRIYAKNYENPVTFYELATRANPSSAMAFNNRGLIKYDSKDYQAAISHYEIALQIKPDYAEVYVNRGNCKNDLNDKSGAMADYELAIKYKTTLFQAHFNKANIMNITGQLKESLKEYDIAMKLYPTYLQGYITRGVVKFQLKDYTGALADFNKTIELDKANAEAYLDRGKVYFMQNEHKKACKDWKTAAGFGMPEAETLLQQYCKQ
jgi:tetratricopeptide (TPR) repeat protein